MGEESAILGQLAFQNTASLFAVHLEVKSTSAFRRIELVKDCFPFGLIQLFSSLCVFSYRNHYGIGVRCSLDSIFLLATTILDFDGTDGEMVDHTVVMSHSRDKLYSRR